MKTDYFKIPHNKHLGNSHDYWKYIKLIMGKVMRYENHNPQYIYLLEKIEELDREIKRLNDDVIEAYEMCDECVKIAEHFNKLPWYKKMFYKFKL